jgi:hypothetical protein
MSLFDDAKQKAEKAAGDHPDQVEKVSDQAVERGGDAADHVTGDKYADEDGTAQKKADEHIGE